MVRSVSAGTDRKPDEDESEDLDRNRVVVPLRWRDLDHLGHVYHGTMLTLLDEARTRWFDDQLGLASADAYVVARVEIDYRREIRLDRGCVEVEFALQRIGSKSITTRELVRTSTSEPAVEAFVTAVLWDPSNRCSRAITDPEREQMSQFAREGIRSA